MNRDKIYEIIGKYLAGEATEVERNEFLNWIKNSDRNAKEFELHKNAWEASRIKFDTQNVDFVFRNVLNTIDGHQEQEISRIDKGDIKKQRFNFLIISKIAASIIIFAALAYIIFINSSNYAGESQTVSIVTKENPSGQKSKIFLPDGSEVVLNAASKISFPEIFSDSLRVVDLEGEAFFDVIRNPAKPFLVRSGHISTTVLGTSFNVKAFEEENTIYIALKSGKVKVDISNEHGQQELYLEPGEGIRYDRSSQLAIKEKLDEDLLVGWKDGKIVFKDADFDYIINTLSRWYGVTFSVENKNNVQWDYTGPFENENLDNVLKSIGFTKGFTHTFDENNPEKVLIKFN